ncbi:MAG: prepilin-type N-terminal cleavage/methylation domain-containing protein [Deltaproteobacteria bacterium]|nr:prepilin-type N-terminal cleavage/methylation domain-containing protein [Candidatus Anaeroferrophillus wilburensis]MBN2888882.1 prepilin-type N-terminal cleavage/methylation domain-containing protein [Deltaproteobacteria bacterium]
MMNKDQSNRGFTLIELMIAMVVMAFGILGYMFLMNRAIEGRVFSREMSRAVIVTQQQLDQLLAADFNSDLLAAGNHPTAAEDTADGNNADGLLTTTMQGFEYNTRWEVTDTTATLKTIEVETTWNIKGEASTATRFRPIYLGSMKRE